MRLQFSSFDLNSLSEQKDNEELDARGNVWFFCTVLFIIPEAQHTISVDEPDCVCVYVNCNGTVNTLRPLRPAKAVSCDRSVGGLREALTHAATKIRDTMRREYESESLFIHDGRYKQHIFHPY